MSAPRGVVYRVVILERDAEGMNKYTISDALDRYDVTVVEAKETGETVELEPEDWG